MKPAKMIATLAIAGGLAVGAVGGAGVANADDGWQHGDGHGWHGGHDGGGRGWGDGGGWNGGGWNGGGWNGGGWNGWGGGGPCVTGPLGFVTVCA
jgi:hypothetical protein